MSSSSGELSLSIVIGSNGAPASVESCLAALEPQVDGAEVLVCEPEASPPEVRECFPFARFLERPGGGIQPSESPLSLSEIEQIIAAVSDVERRH